MEKDGVRVKDTRTLTEPKYKTCAVHVLYDLVTSKIVTLANV